MNCGCRAGCRTALSGVSARSRLPAQTAYVMTVHKSLGSEFAHTALVLLGAATSPLVSCGLLYTALDGWISDHIAGRVI